MGIGVKRDTFHFELPAEWPVFGPFPGKRPKETLEAATSPDLQAPPTGPVSPTHSRPCLCRLTPLRPAVRLTREDYVRRHCLLYGKYRNTGIPANSWPAKDRKQVPRQVHRDRTAERQKQCHLSIQTVNPLEHPDALHFHAALGWLELGNWHEANEELANITPELRVHPDVLTLRWQIYAKAKKWEACVDLAEAVVKPDPNRSEGWIHRSCALHELRRPQEAFDRLLPVAEKFPKSWTIPYNLSCYCSQLGQFEAAKDWFKKAMAIDEHTVKRQAIEDHDLKPLWDSMGGTLWKRE